MLVLGMFRLVLSFKIKALPNLFFLIPRLNEGVFSESCLWKSQQENAGTKMMVMLQINNK